MPSIWEGAPPRLPVPLGATDCHHHIYDPRFPRPDGKMLPECTAADYRIFRARLGLTRDVIVAASPYWNDNRCLLDALDQLGETSRGVVIVNPDVTDHELDQMYQRNVRGIRIYLGKGRVPSIDEMKTFGRRCADRGWHILIVGDRKHEVIAGWEETLAGLPCPVVIDHFGFAPFPPGVETATFRAIKYLLDRGKDYVKLSGVYIPSKTGYPTYSDLDPIAIACVQRAPERCLWGTDWPHPTATGPKPDGAWLFDQLGVWAPDEATRHAILVDNPSRLYWAS